MTFRKSPSKRLRQRTADVWLKIRLFFRFHCFALGLILLITAVGSYWATRLFPHTDFQSAQWALSTEVQSLAALLALMLAAVTFLWSQAAGEETRLRDLQPKYYELL